MVGGEEGVEAGRAIKSKCLISATLETSQLANIYSVLVSRNDQLLDCQPCVGSSHLSDQKRLYVAEEEARSAVIKDRGCWGGRHVAVKIAAISGCIMAKLTTQLVG